MVLTPAVAQEAEDLLSKFSNDELCVCWRAFDRLQLLDRAMLLKLGGRVHVPFFVCPDPILVCLPIKGDGHPQINGG